MPTGAIGVLAALMEWGEERDWAFRVIIGLSLYLLAALWAQKCRDDIEKESDQTVEAELRAEIQRSAQKFSDRLAEVQASYIANQATMAEGFTSAAKKFSERTAGSVTAVMRHIYEYQPRTNRAAQLKDLKNIQQNLLTICVETVSRWGAREDLSANWCIRSGDNFAVVTYDRERVDRHPSSHPIHPDAVGASMAFLSGDVSLVDDTSKHPSIFIGPTAYKCILSCPATRGAKGTDAVIGVVNIDSPVPETLAEGDARLVADLVSIIGLVEMLKHSLTN